MVVAGVGAELGARVVLEEACAALAAARSAFPLALIALAKAFSVYARWSNTPSSKKYD